MSRFLLDTCALIWWLDDSDELGRAARRAIKKPDNEILVSAASLWEIAIKRRRGRLTGVDDYLARYPDLHADWGFRTLVIEPEDAVAAGLLAFEHNDPFDRLLIVQANRLDARIITCDEAITRHSPRCVW